VRYSVLNENAQLSPSPSATSKIEWDERRSKPDLVNQRTAP
jgi:hypothetical protein